MDWRQDNGADPSEPRSFLYAVPLSDDAVLLEETCLAGRPALDSTVLRDRLTHRLRSRGITLTGEERIERVRFPVHGGKPGRTTFGAAGGLLHPASGYSVATALRTADTLSAGDSIWPHSARAVHALRLAGLRVLLALPRRISLSSSTPSSHSPPHDSAPTSPAAMISPAPPPPCPRSSRRCPGDCAVPSCSPQQGSATTEKPRAGPVG